MRHEFIPTDTDMNACEFCTAPYSDHSVERVDIYAEDEIYGTEYLDLSYYAPNKEEW